MSEENESLFSRMAHDEPDSFLGPLVCSSANIWQSGSRAGQKSYMSLKGRPRIRLNILEDTDSSSKLRPMWPPNSRLENFALREDRYS